MITYVFETQKKIWEFIRCLANEIQIKFDVFVDKNIWLEIKFDATVLVDENNSMAEVWTHFRFKRTEKLLSIIQLLCIFNWFKWNTNIR